MKIRVIRNKKNDYTVINNFMQKFKKEPIFEKIAVVIFEKCIIKFQKVFN